MLGWHGAHLPSGQGFTWGLNSGNLNRSIRTVPSDAIACLQLTVCNEDHRGEIDLLVARQMALVSE